MWVEKRLKDRVRGTPVLGNSEKKEDPAEEAKKAF